MGKKSLQLMAEIDVKIAPTVMNLLMMRKAILSLPDGLVAK